MPNCSLQGIGSSLAVAANEVASWQRASSQVGAVSQCDKPPLLEHQHIVRAKTLLANLLQDGAPMQRLPGAATNTRLQWTIACGLHVLAKGVHGDFAETGVYLGGTSIAMMSVLREHQSDKTHWACDSFQGLPAPNTQDVWLGTTRIPASGLPKALCRAKQGADVVGCGNPRRGLFKANESTFLSNVAHFGLPTTPPRLRIVKGWFHESLPPAGMGNLSMLRLDGDLFVSTMAVLKRLYPRVSPGGIVFVDDMGSYAGCAAAVNSYRAAHNISAPLHKLHEQHTGFRRFEAVFWVKGAVGGLR